MSRHAALLPILLALCLSAQANDDVAALIKRQSQEFSDASASGDAKVLGKYLDDRVLFMNEGGDMPTKKEIVDGAQPPANGMKNQLT